jgi:hypothetical protein
MWRRDTAVRVIWLETALAVLILLESNSAIAQGADSAQERPISVLGRRDPVLARAINVVVPRAAEKLQNERCQQLLSEFRDDNGRTLQENLEERGESPSGYLRWLIFVNAAEEGFCVQRGMIAATNPGDRIIRLCSPFRAIALSDPAHAADLLIHEELHSLGLGENPPSSYEITRKVVGHCGRRGPGVSLRNPSLSGRDR